MSLALPESTSYLNGFLLSAESTHSCWKGQENGAISQRTAGLSSLEG